MRIDCPAPDVPPLPPPPPPPKDVRDKNVDVAEADREVVAASGVALSEG